MQYVEDQARKAGIVVPFISNDAWTGAHNAPGTGEGEVDIYVCQPLFPEWLELKHMRPRTDQLLTGPRWLPLGL
jgi:hypothetical protein